ncbi:MAG: hypothetical protein HOY79_24950 [Streptomyces sp.]|nr:hypothetical protein [Streptomyces sp.]
MGTFEDASGSGSAPGSGHGAPSARPAPAPSSALIFDDPLDRPSSDDTDRGWGGAASDAADDDFARFLNEKPPHHL